MKKNGMGSNANAERLSSRGSEARRGVFRDRGRNRDHGFGRRSLAAASSLATSAIGALPNAKRSRLRRSVRPLSHEAMACGAECASALRRALESARDKICMTSDDLLKEPFRISEPLVDKRGTGYEVLNGFFRLSFPSHTGRQRHLQDQVEEDEVALAGLLRRMAHCRCPPLPALEPRNTQEMSRGRSCLYYQ